MSIETAFRLICANAIEHKPGGYTVSLYESIPFYGGPEEGGWWGEDFICIASEKFKTEERAEAARLDIHTLAVRLGKEAQQQHGTQCLAELAYCEERGIDDSNSVFGEVAGPSRYQVVTEEYPGELQCYGDRYWS